MAQFQRARTPEQQAERRAAILRTARAMLADAPPADVSLRELSARVGLAKSNVVRYFPTREAIFLEVLLEDWTAWLDDVEQRVADGQPVPAAIASAVPAHARFASLLSEAPAVLERNVPAATARAFKRGAAERTARLAGLVERSGVGPGGAARFAGVVWVLLAGAWPMANPGPVVAEVLRDPGLAALCIDLVPDLTDVLTALLEGIRRTGVS